MTETEVVIGLRDFSEALRKEKRKAAQSVILRQWYGSFADDGREKEAKEFLLFLFDPKVVTGLSSKKICKSVPNAGVLAQGFLQMCTYLRRFNTGRDEDIAAVQHFIASFPEDCQAFLIAFFTKNLPLGVEAKTVNKILEIDLIPEWEVQQGYPIDKYKLKPNEWFSLSQKLNGNRGTCYNGKIISRQGQEFSGLEHIIKEIQILGLEDYVLDGELIRKNVDGVSDGENFRIGTGILNSNAKEKPEIKFVVFEILHKEEFDTGKSAAGYMLRARRLNRYRELILASGIHSIEIVPIVYQGTDKSQIDYWLQYAVDHDWEGLMLNRDVPYRRTRHNGCLKVKRFYTMDLRITAVEEGQNRLAGTLGALVVDFKGNELRVGSGFDDNTRARVWRNPDIVIGKIVEVKYKEITKDKKTGLESLQFPTFVRFRDDKNEVSYG